MKISSTPDQREYLRRMVGQLQGKVTGMQPFYDLWLALNPQDNKELSDVQGRLLLDLLQEWPRYSPPDLAWVGPLIDELKQNLIQ